MSYAFAALDIAKRQLGRKEEGREKHGKAEGPGVCFDPAPHAGAFSVNP